MRLHLMKNQHAARAIIAAANKPKVTALPPKRPAVMAKSAGACK